MLLFKMKLIKIILMCWNFEIGCFYYLFILSFSESQILVEKCIKRDEKNIYSELKCINLRTYFEKLPPKSGLTGSSFVHQNSHIVKY
jgi:hypothetical protein